MRERLLFVTGLLCIGGGVICNEWILAALFSSDGIIAVPHRIIIWVIDLLSIGVGLALIRYRRVLKKEALLIMAGLVTIFAAILAGELFVPALLGSALGKENRFFLRFTEMLFVCGGSMVILFRSSADMKSAVLLGSSLSVCFASFLLYDVVFLSFSSRSHLGSLLAEHRIQDVHVGDAKLGWKPRTGKSRHTHQDYDVTYDVDQDSLRTIGNGDRPDFSIWFFGDSFTFGAGLENHDTFGNIIRHRHMDEEVNIYNAGVMGYGMTQMFVRFRENYERIKEGDIVVFSPISEDIYRSACNPFHWVTVVWLYRVLYPLSDVKTYPWFDNGIISYRAVESNMWTRFEIAALMAPYTGIYWCALIYGRAALACAVEESLAMIDLVKERTKKRGGKFALIFLPTRDECAKGRYDADVSRFAYLDVLRFFPSREEELRKVFFPTDGHYNAEGHALAARAIVQTLVDHRIIDRKYLKTPLQHEGSP